ncbi:MAG: hypothetical protein NVS2B16_15440 [Chloroflexota bacterium]
MEKIAHDRNRDEDQAGWLTLPGGVPLALLFGLALAVSYTVFAVLASLHYPTAYSPFNNNTLSQLGNSDLNPRGAPFYLIGCALSGMFAIAFFVTLTPWRRTGTCLQNRLLMLVQALGVIGGFALVMNAVYPENQFQAHHFWAGVLFNCLGSALFLASFALRRRDRPNRSLTGVTMLAAVAVVVMFIFARTHWVEWVPVTLFLISPCLLGFHTRKLVLQYGQPG